MVGGVASFGCRCRQGERQQSRLSWRPFAGRRARESICLLNPIDGRIAFVRACSPPGRPATLLASIRWNVTPPCPRCTVIFPVEENFGTDAETRLCGVRPPCWPHARARRPKKKERKMVRAWARPRVPHVDMQIWPEKRSPIRFKYSPSHLSSSS